ncbi:hypothetical protein [uncultured Clostridium sp.]|jgi:hypothetical protein|uniref:hypothetical protein n=1 Tax=uncultured Clostridium sp. TaxID=59620 RepID=UPI0025EF9EA0|nr:hypothetical protein [uncultured Clostridium sp.]
MGSMYDYRYENPPAKEVYECADCGYGIFLGDAYYEINDVFICEDCMEQYKKECEDEEWL